MELKKKNLHGSLIRNLDHPYSKQYLTFQFTTDGYLNMVIQWDSNSVDEPVIYYNKADSENSWKQLQLIKHQDSDGVCHCYMKVYAGESVRLSCDLLANKIYQWHFADTTAGNNPANFNLSGNIMSLIYGDSFTQADKTEFTTELKQFLMDEKLCSIFERMFEYSSVKDANKLYLPTINLLPKMYAKMFAGSTLEVAPQILPAILDSDCYLKMFSDCVHLTGNITIPKAERYGAVYNSYVEMFHNTPNENLFVDFLPTMSEDLYVDYSVDGVEAGLCFFNTGISRGRYVLPWDEINQNYPFYDKNTGTHLWSTIQTQLLRFKSQSFTYGWGDESQGILPKIETKYTLSPDVFKKVMTVTNDDSEDMTAFLQHLSGIDDVTNISLIEPLEYFAEQPLTFEAVDICEFKWRDDFNGSDGDGDIGKDYLASSPKHLQYSLNGSPWIDYTGGVVVPKGSKISWRSTVDLETLNRNSLPIYTYFQLVVGGNNNDIKMTIDKDGDWEEDTHQIPTGQFNISGNIMSLCSPNFSTIDTMPENFKIGVTPADSNIDRDNAWEYVGWEMFQGIFHNCPIIDAENLVLPAIHLSDYCYSHMFDGSLLSFSPFILPVKNPRSVRGCYAYMFHNCKNLLTTPVIMTASTFDFDMDGENTSQGIKKTWVIQNNSRFVNIQATWDTPTGTMSDTHISVNNSCSNLFVYMFSDSSIRYPQHIYVNYIYSDTTNGAGWRGMYKNCKIQNLKMHTHNTSSGYTYYRVTDLFGNILTPWETESGDTYTPTLECYEECGSGEYQLSDMWLRRDNSRTFNISNLYTESDQGSEDTTEEPLIYSITTTSNPNYGNAYQPDLKADNIREDMESDTIIHDIKKRYMSWKQWMDWYENFYGRSPMLTVKVNGISYWAYVTDEYRNIAGGSYYVKMNIANNSLNLNPLYLYDYKTGQHVATWESIRNNGAYVLIPSL